MPKKIDLTGQRFGRLVVLYESGERKNGKIVWHCRCDCGNEVDIRGGGLTSGNTRSCGCYNRERVAERNTVHGMNRPGERHPVYAVWKSMLQRCENPNCEWYKDYGGRGITVCEEWHNFQIFYDWSISYGWQKGLQIDRIDNNGDYKPDNCRFVTPKENSRNRRNNRFITFNGRTQSLAAWAEEAEVNRSTLQGRINRGHWPIERALTEPIRERIYPPPG